VSVRVELRHGVYRDSVILMQVSQAVAACRGVEAAIVAMATPLNLELYERLGFDPAEVAQASPNDLLVALRADDDPLAAATAELERQLAPAAPSGTHGFGATPPPRTLASALRQGGSLALI
jgi:FdrA protein